MSLYWGSASPFVRKVMVCAYELGLSGRVDTLDSAANPIERDTRIQAYNPLAKVPAACTSDGLMLYDSRVICEYLDALASEEGGASAFRLFPSACSGRWTALRRQALADGLLDAALLIRYENLLRPEPLRWPEWIGKQSEKVNDALDAMCSDVPDADALDIGTISYGCALAWLDFRFPDLQWRSGRTALADWLTIYSERPSMAATRPTA
ncbi:glutathione S-transferase family protein (plasmid) [Rhizobium bangladeshense]|uniref:glutathione S-transferase family protein n=1 Tax=Rhizobium bangladeshense TaxID=1138189 RepID=UPI001A99C2AA|nr:glutathione S-transferase family protein [Rhizobium bangladeshense]QSY98043.1 glutathione S-transferase family protein [Rhizobium bangladeshense]